MEDSSQFIDHFADVKSILAVALSALTQKIISNIHEEDISINDVSALASTLQKLVSCYAELEPLQEMRIRESHNLVSPEVIDSIQKQLNLL